MTLRGNIMPTFDSMDTGSAPAATPPAVIPKADQNVTTKAVWLAKPGNIKNDGYYGGPAIWCCFNTVKGKDPYCNTPRGNPGHCDDVNSTDKNIYLTEETCNTYCKPPAAAAPMPLAPAQ